MEENVEMALREHERTRDRSLAREATDTLSGEEFVRNVEIEKVAAKIALARGKAKLIKKQIQQQIRQDYDSKITN